jgi:hypothetical protein
MGNKSSKPKPTTRPTAPRTLPRFFTVRDPAFKGFEIVNLDRVVGAVFQVNRTGYPTIEIITAEQDREQTPNGLGIGSYCGAVACDVAAHLVLVGVDVEGAAEALHRARPGMYEQLHAARSKCLADDAKNAAQIAALPCVRCEDCSHAYSTVGGSVALDCELGTCRDEQKKCVDFDPREMASSSTPVDHYQAACLTPPPAIGPEPEELLRAVEQLGQVAEVVGTSADRDLCAYGSACRRFPRCEDCSLYALRDRAERASIEHVEEVAGMTKGELWRLVDTCEVHRGFLRHGAKPGEVQCRAGYDLAEPSCAICPYLPVAAPSRNG